MNLLWVAYNDFGDLIAESYSRRELEWRVEARGYDVDDVLIGQVTP